MHLEQTMTDEGSHTTIHMIGCGLAVSLRGEAFDECCEEHRLAGQAVDILFEAGGCNSRLELVMDQEDFMLAAALMSRVAAMLDPKMHMTALDETEGAALTRDDAGVWELVHGS